MEKKKLFHMSQVCDALTIEMAKCLWSLEYTGADSGEVDGWGVGGVPRRLTAMPTPMVVRSTFFRWFPTHI